MARGSAPSKRMIRPSAAGSGPLPAPRAAIVDNPQNLVGWSNVCTIERGVVGSSALWLVAQANTAFTGGVGGLLGHTGPVARFVLILLAVFSLISWAIILYKGIALHRAYGQSRTFLDVFRKSSKFSEV